MFFMVGQDTRGSSLGCQKKKKWKKGWQIHNVIPVKIKVNNRREIRMKNI